MEHHPQNKAVGFIRTKDYIGEGGLFGKSGPIKCDKGFKVRFDLRNPMQGESDWTGTFVCLVDDRIPVSQVDSYLADSGI